MEKKIKISISGAAEIKNCINNIEELCKKIGKALAKNDVIVITGATTGVPYLVAKSAYENGAEVLGFSPAKDEEEHKNIYELPTDYHKIIFYTGTGHSLRNLLLIRAGDAALFICGRTGTLNEFIIAFEEKKPMGILVGSGGEEKNMDEIIKESCKEHNKIIWEKDPEILVEKLINLVKNDLHKNL
ncbi:MAG: hypothetical protein QXD43_04510 [Candidatus Aenigmatarchaeota archaeon]